MPRGPSCRGTSAKSAPAVARSRGRLQHDRGERLVVAGIERRHPAGQRDRVQRDPRVVVARRPARCRAGRSPGSRAPRPPRCTPRCRGGPSESPSGGQRSARELEGVEEGDDVLVGDAERAGAGDERLVGDQRLGVDVDRATTVPDSPLLSTAATYCFPGTPSSSMSVLSTSVPPLLAIPWSWAPCNPAATSNSSGVTTVL